MSTQILSLIVILFVGFGSACTPIKSKDLLGGEFDIAASTEEVAKKLTTKGVEYVVVEASHLDQDDPRPEFSIVTWETGDIQLLGIQGRAKFSFFNDRLLLILFTPNKASELLAAGDALGVSVTERVKEDGVNRPSFIGDSLVSITLL